MIISGIRGYSYYTPYTSEVGPPKRHNFIRDHVDRRFMPGTPVVRTGVATNQVGPSTFNGAGNLTSAAILGLADITTTNAAFDYYGQEGLASPILERLASQDGARTDIEVVTVAADPETYVTIALHQDEITGVVNAAVIPTTLQALVTRLYNAYFGQDVGLKKLNIPGTPGGSSILGASKDAASIKYFTVLPIIDPSINELKITGAGVDPEAMVILHCMFRGATSQHVNPALAGGVLAQGTSQGTPPSGGSIAFQLPI